jgi:hypothetical protein
MTEEYLGISLKNLAPLIPQRLMEKFSLVGAETVGDVVKLEDDAFRLTKSMGKQIFLDYLQFKSDIQNRPQEIVNCNQAMIFDFSSLSKNILDLELKSIIGIIPRRLVVKLERLNSITVNDAVNLSWDDIVSAKAIGSTTAKDYIEFRSLLAINPELLPKVELQNKGDLLPRVYKSDFLADLKAFVTGFFELLPRNMAFDIINKRYALESDSPYTLEDIGLFYNITRERVRQIQNKTINHLRNFLNVGFLKKPKCVCHPQLHEKYKQLSGQLSNQSVVWEKTLLSIYHENGLIIDSIQKEHFIVFLTEVFGGVQYTYQTSAFYIFNNSIDHTIYEQVCSQVFTLLKREVKPIRLFDVVVRIGKKNRKIDRSLIEQVLKNLPNIHCIQDENGEDQYLVAFHKLSSLGDYAYRILFDTKELMHLTRIWREIQHRLVSNNNEHLEAMSSLRNQLVSDNRFTPLGKSGKWGLLEWGMNSSSIIDLTLKALIHFDKPSTLKEISEYVNNIRPGTRPESISSIIAQHGDKVCKYRRATFIHSDWKSHYQDLPDHGYSAKRLSMEQFCRVITEIYHQNKLSQYTARELFEFLRIRGILWSYNYTYLRLFDCPSLKKEKSGVKTLFSFIDGVQTIKKTGKLETIKIKVEDILRKSQNQEKALNELVEELEKIGTSRPSVYAVISKNNDLFEKVETSSGVVIRIKDHSEEIGKKKGLEQHLQRIKDGETKTVEFKSSLRWDLKENKPNPELEFVVTKVIAAFLNTEGGYLYIGVADDSNLLGIEHDYSTLQKGNRDGFLLHLNNLLIKYFGRGVFAHVGTEIVEIHGRDIAVVTVKKADKETYLIYKGEKVFLIRASASVQSLDIEAAAQYVSANFKRLRI